MKFKILLLIVLLSPTFFFGQEKSKDKTNNWTVSDSFVKEKNVKGKLDFLEFTEKGTYLLEAGTELSFISEKDEYYLSQRHARNYFNTNLIGGYFLYDNLLIAISIDYVNYKTKVEYDANYSYYNVKKSDLTSTRFIFSPTIRYYLNETGIWGQFSYGFGFSDQNDKYEYYNDQEGKFIRSSFESLLSLGLGYAYPITKNITLNPLFSYYMHSNTYKGDDVYLIGYYNQDTDKYEDLSTKTSGFIFKMGLSIHF